MAKNNVATAKGTAAERAKTTEINRGIKAQQGLLRVQQQRQSQNLAQLRTGNGLLSESRKQTDLLSRATGGLGTQLAALGFASIATEVTQFATDSIRAGVRVEGFRNSLTALYGDAQIAEGVLDDLREAAQLPGITFAGAVQGAIRLKTVGVEGDRATAVIREFGNAAALAGAGTDEVGRALVGFTQILSRGKVSQEEINQVLENVPLIGNSIREAFGSIDAEVIREQLDSAGQGVQDFADILVNQLSKGARASADSAANAFSNLGNATFELQAAIGDRLTPAVKDAATGLTELLTSATNFISGTNDATRSVGNYTDALQRAADTASVNAAIKARIEFLQGEKTALDEASEGRANYFRFRGRETEAGAAYREITDELNALNTAQGDTTAGLTHFRGIQENLIGTAKDLTAEISRLETEIGGRTGKSVQGLNRDLRVNRDELTAVQGKIETTSNAVKALTTANLNASESTDKVTESTGEATESTKDLEVEVRTLTELYSGLIGNIEKASETTQTLSEFQSENNDFFRLARGEIEGYDASIQTVIPSVINLTDAEDALTSAVEANIAILDEFAGDAQGLVDTYESLSDGLTSVAADQAILNAEINLVNPAISDAVDSMRDYNAVMGDVQTRFKDVDEISQDLTASIRTQGTAFDDLRSNVDTADISLDVLEDTIVALPSNVDLATDAFNTFGRDTISILNAVGSSLGNLEGEIGLVATALGEFGKFAQNPATFTADFLGGFIEDLQDAYSFDPEDSSGRVLQRFEGDGGFADVGSTIDDAELANIRTILARPEGLEFLRQNFQGIFADPAVEALIREILPEEAGRLFDQERPSNVTRFDPVTFEGDTSRGSGQGAPRVRSDTQTRYVIDPATNEIVPVTTLDAPLPGSEAGVPRVGRTAGAQVDRITGAQVDETGTDGTDAAVRMFIEDTEERVLRSIIRPVFRGVLKGISDYDFELSLDALNALLSDFSGRYSDRITSGIINPALQEVLKAISETRDGVSLTSEVSDDISGGADNISNRIRTSILNPVFRVILSGISETRDSISLTSDISDDISGGADNISNRIRTSILNPVFRVILSGISETRDSVSLTSEVSDDISKGADNISKRICTSILNPTLRTILSGISEKRDGVSLPSEVSDDILEGVDDISNRIRTSILNPVFRVILSAISETRDSVSLTSEVSDDILEGVDDISDRIRTSIIRPVFREVLRTISEATGNVEIPSEITSDITESVSDITERIFTSIIQPIIHELSGSIREVRGDIELPADVTTQIAEFPQTLAENIFQYVVDPVFDTYLRQIRDLRGGITTTDFGLPAPTSRPVAQPTPAFALEPILEPQRRMIETQEQQRVDIQVDTSRQILDSEEELGRERVSIAERTQREIAREQMRLAEETAREQQALFGTQQRRDAQFSDIQLGGARSREDLGIQTQRAITDILRSTSSFGLAVPDLAQSRGLSSEIFSRFSDREAQGGGYRDLRSIFSDLGLNLPESSGISPFGAISELLNVDFTRSDQDIGLREGRERQDLEMQISLDEERIAFAMAIDTSGAGFELSAINAGASLETSASNAGSSFETSVASAGSSLAGAIAGAIASAAGAGGNIVLMADGRQIATVVNDANVSLGASGGIVSGGGGV